MEDERQIEKRRMRGDNRNEERKRMENDGRERGGG